MERNVTNLKRKILKDIHIDHVANSNLRWAKIKSCDFTFVSSCIILKYQYVKISPSFHELKYSQFRTNGKVMIPVGIVSL